MESAHIVTANRDYWDTHAHLWFGTTALPEYGVHFATEDELCLFDDVSGQRLLEICCGSGHSLIYHARRGAGELWGVDISRSQLANAEALLGEHGYTARLICAPMEADLDIPKGYFDTVYSIYGIGWTTDLSGTFGKIAGYLRSGGHFIFSWNHTLNFCIGRTDDLRRDALEDGKLVMRRSYFDESYFTLPVHDSSVILCNRMMSTYINALAGAGFCVERLVEQPGRQALEAGDDAPDKLKKAKMLPMSFCIKARKL